MAKMSSCIFWKPCAPTNFCRCSPCGGKVLSGQGQFHLPGCLYSGRYVATAPSLRTFGRAASLSSKHASRVSESGGHGDRFPHKICLSQRKVLVVERKTGRINTLYLIGPIDKLINWPNGRFSV